VDDKIGRARQRDEPVAFIGQVGTLSRARGPSRSASASAACNMLWNWRRRGADECPLRRRTAKVGSLSETGR
jgi:hypothetical protein